MCPPCYDHNEPVGLGPKTQDTLGALTAPKITTGQRSLTVVTGLATAEKFR